MDYPVTSAVRYLRERNVDFVPRLYDYIEKGGTGESAKQLGVGEGDTLIGEIAPDGRLILSAEARAIGKVEVRRMREFLARQKVTAPVVGDMRRSARY